MSDLANLYISPRLAAREILSALRGTVLVADIDGKVLYQREGSRKISGEHIDIIVSNVIKQGAQQDYRVMIDQTPYVVAANYFRGGVAIVLHDLTEIEIEEQKEQEVYEELKIKLDREKMIRQTTEVITKAENIDQIDLIVMEVKEKLSDDSQAARALKRVAQLGKQRLELLEKLGKDKIALEEKLKQIEKVNDESVARELKIIELKERLKNS